MTTTCSYCGKESDFYFRSRDYNRNITPATFDHYLCPDCGLIFISSVPENLGDYYPNNYHHIPETVAFLEANQCHEKYKIRLIKQYVQQGRLLEIGPSLGSFSYLAKHSGFEPEAIEMDAECSRFLNDVAGIPTLNSDDVTEALSSLGSFDVIAMWHVIEHLPDPWDTLEHLVHSINVDGILVLAAPNPNAFQFRMLGRYWPHVDAPRHLMLIPPQLLTDRMNSLGMKLELATTNDEGGLGWNLFGWEYYFSNLSRLPIINPILRTVGRVVAKLASPIEQREGNGCAYTMIFRKKG